ncbi:TetR/AcrR family transcriptional regulator C-terminal domain-containing protein [Phenylobacterium aquaticum]|uniref:TetR/AcrR family transcriptional regulator C-terminal domain-containing protein n=1 Tax=Phenylobacterium aquaticum TaxID=1763816 RepID=UPI001F5E098D|nr:TetR/AcrR family transcriptional regulator C-terminal domain-containing protein [Phenylobacterium aquaticum]MCI3135137.1 TetR/AcrR family transcriptional regulator C-terminal domain-containing protein [Phenylobacterium aquaticum]
MRRPQLTLEMVLEAAARVLEAEGYEGLTMRAVAAELRVQAPALYWYVDSKEALEVALYEHLMADLAFDVRGDDWREDIRRMAQQMRAHLLSRRDFGRLRPSGFFVGTSSMAQTEIVLGVLLGAGLKPRDAFYALTTGFNYVLTWSIGEADVAKRRGPAISEADKALLASGAYPHFMSLMEAFTEPGDVDEQFLFGLNCLIAGFERLIP